MTLQGNIRTFRKQVIVAGVGVAGWISLKYLPYSNLAHTSGLLLCGTEYPARSEVMRLKALQIIIPDNEVNLYEVLNLRAKTIIEKAVRDINITRQRPMDISKVKFLSNMSVHVGTEYHAGSLKRRAYIVLPGTFGMTSEQRPGFLTGRYFDMQAIDFSLLDYNTWKFVVAKELLYMEEEGNLMKFRMLLGSFLLCVSYGGNIYIHNKYVNTKENIQKLIRRRMKNPRYKIMERNEMNRMAKNSLFRSLIGNITAGFLISFCIYKICLYGYFCQRTTKLDKALADLGKDYIMAGVDYFEKKQLAGTYQRAMLNQNKFSQSGYTEMKRFLFFIPKIVHDKDRLEFFKTEANK